MPVPRVVYLASDQFNRYRPEISHTDNPAWMVVFACSWFDLDMKDGTTERHLLACVRQLISEPNR